MILVVRLFSSTYKWSLTSFIHTLYPKSFILCKKAVYNSLSLKVYSPYDFQLRTQKVPLIFLILMYHVLGHKEVYLENHHHQKSVCQENNLNHVAVVSQFYFALHLILFLLLMLQFLYLSQNSLQN